MYGNQCLYNYLIVCKSAEICSKCWIKKSEIDKDKKYGNRNDNNGRKITKY